MRTIRSTTTDAEQTLHSSVQGFLMSRIDIWGMMRLLCCDSLPKTPPRTSHLHQGRALYRLVQGLFYWVCKQKDLARMQGRVNVHLSSSRSSE